MIVVTTLFSLSNEVLQNVMLAFLFLYFNIKQDLESLFFPP